MRMVAASELMADRVNTYAALAKASGAADDCKLAVAPTFKVEPDVQTLQVDIPSTTLFAISGGTGPARAAIVGKSQGENVKAKPQLTDGFYGVVLEATAKAVDGTVTLVISDGTVANHKSIEITLKKPAAPGEKPKQP
jgi:hypothetical protein